MNGIIFYFSGTGNSKYIAGLFAEKMRIKCVNIEAQADAAKMIDDMETIAFCYPIYGSWPPRLMREFVEKYRHYLDGKKLIIFCTQLLGSGDGARSLTDLLAGIRYTVIYAEHFLMPNNVNNVFFLPVTYEKRNARCYAKAEQKMNRVCRNIENGKVIKRGFCMLSKWFGLTQRVFMPRIEEKSKNLVFINHNCTRCGLCADACPVENLKLSENGVIALGNCMMCYRCTNLCPQKAIKVLFRQWPKKQYVFTGSILVKEK